MHFSDTNQALEIARNLYPNANNLQLIDHGYNNIVVLVDDEFTIKFPRDAEAALNNRFEARILHYFESIKYVQIPKVISENTEPLYTIYVQVLGDTLTKKQLAELSKESATILGEEIASLAFDLHNAVKPNDLLQIKQELNFDPDLLAWPTYLKNALESCGALSPSQNILAQTYYAKWQNLDKHTNKIVIHDDLHKNNLLTINNHLSGVIDFGDMTIGTAEQELRLILSLNDSVYRACISKYVQLSGNKLDENAIFVWAVVQELSKYATYFTKNTTDNYSFRRAQKFLNRWLPAGNW